MNKQSLSNAVCHAFCSLLETSRDDLVKFNVACYCLENCADDKHLHKLASHALIEIMKNSYVEPVKVQAAQYIHQHPSAIYTEEEKKPAPKEEKNWHRPDAVKKPEVK